MEGSNCVDHVLAVIGQHVDEGKWKDLQKITLALQADEGLERGYGEIVDDDMSFYAVCVQPYVGLIAFHQFGSD